MPPGTLNGRSISGLATRRSGTPTHTSTNASSVPIDTSSPTRLIGITPPQKATNRPVSVVAIYGVPCSLWTAPNQGSSPSLLIA